MAECRRAQDLLQSFYQRGLFEIPLALFIRL